MLVKRLFSASLLVMSLFAYVSYGEEQADPFLLEMSLEKLLNIKVSSASLTEKSQRFSPSTISYITAEDIAMTGARTLSDVLRLVPGIDVQERRNGRDMVWIRGIPSGRNTKIMLIVDGVPHREPVFGGWSPDEEVPLNNIDHIEVIRGPGSALYGGNAYSGLVSIFTRDEPPAKNQVSLTAGSFDSQRLKVDLGQKWQDSSWMFSGGLYQTDGHAMVRDRRGNSTDHNNEVFSYNAHVKVVADNIRAAVNINHYNTEYPLYSRRQTKPQDYEILSAYIEHQDSWEKSEWFNQAYLYQVDREMDRRRWDEQGTIFFQSSSALDTQLLGITSRFTYQWRQHEFLLGAVAESLQVDDYSEIINIDNYQPVREVQSILNKNGDSTPSADNYALFIQDDIALLEEQLALTLSLRFDDYQEFDAELSPRLGLVYAPDETWTFKGMWGDSFRPPSNLQQYEVRSDGNSPGNPNVGPEKITTKEVDISYRLSDEQNISARYFHNSLSDFIQSINTQPYMNIAGSTSVSGYELEYIANFPMKQFSISNLQLKANMTHVNSNEASVALNSGTVNAIFDAAWGSASFTYHYFGRRNASPTYHDRVTDEYFKQLDNKGAYSTFDMNILLRQVWDLPLDIEFTAFNLFNKRYYNPTYAPDSYYDVTREPRFLSIGVHFTF
ncbi:TonB-dependent receptor [Thalassomonas viridans]|uniref:TonB-dependent receptor n=1 Tax=Thalassomonas viridans TaxID=137584 RepID=A0AAE9Z9J6_9GAMM|nr:TonB-dependent receptor [Thalassomonas viridans]WDE08540.1 TonB-dependent receptor [Thalassomonas viridans]